MLSLHQTSLPYTMSNVIGTLPEKKKINAGEIQGKVDKLFRILPS